MKKKQMTVYLSKEYIAKFNEIYAYRLLSNNKATKTNILQEAIELLYVNEYKKSRNSDDQKNSNNG